MHIHPMHCSCALGLAYHMTFAWPSARNSAHSWRAVGPVRVSCFSGAWYKFPRKLECRRVSQFCHVLSGKHTQASFETVNRYLSSSQLAQLFPLSQISFSPATMLKRGCWFSFSLQGLSNSSVISGIEFYHLLHSENSGNLMGTKEVPGSLYLDKMIHQSCKLPAVWFIYELRVKLEVQTCVTDLPWFPFWSNANHILLELDKSSVSVVLPIALPICHQLS